MSELKATHQCTICGARWRELDDFRWNLRSKECGPCCDNVPMGDQIEALEDVALWSGPLTAEEQGMIDDAWQTHKAATPPPASADAMGEVERVARIIEGALIRHGVTDFTGTLDDATAALSAMSPAGEVERAVLAERERCIAACEAERLSEPQDDSDGAYDRAIDDCIAAIREPKP